MCRFSLLLNGKLQQGGFMSKQLSSRQIAPYRESVLAQIKENHIRRIPQHDGRLFLISTAYPGYWLEHTFDALAWARLYPEDADIAISQVRFFTEHQRQDGRLPCNIIDDSILQGNEEIHIYYTQDSLQFNRFTTGNSYLLYSAARMCFFCPAML